MVDLCKSAKIGQKYELLFQFRIIIIGIVLVFWKEKAEEKKELGGYSYDTGNRCFYEVSSGSKENIEKYSSFL